MVEKYFEELYSASQKYYKNDINQFMMYTKLSSLYRYCIEKTKGDENKVLIKEIVSLAKAFNLVDVKVLFIKGYVLSDMLYHDTGARKSNDIDILVDKQNILRCLEILGNEGYYIVADRQRNIHERVNGDLYFKYVEEFPLQRIHFPEFSKDVIDAEGNCFTIKLDCHMAIYHYLENSDKFISKMVQQAVEYNFLGTKLWIPSIEDYVVYMILHYVKENVRNTTFSMLSGWYGTGRVYPKLNLLVDTACLMEKIGDREWDSINTIIHQFDIVEECNYFFKLIDFIDMSLIPEQHNFVKNEVKKDNFVSSILSVVNTWPAEKILFDDPLENISFFLEKIPLRNTDLNTKFGYIQHCFAFGTGGKLTQNAANVAISKSRDEISLDIEFLYEFPSEIPPAVSLYIGSSIFSETYQGFVPQFQFIISPKENNGYNYIMRVNKKTIEGIDFCKYNPTTKHIRIDFPLSLIGDQLSNTFNFIFNVEVDNRNDDGTLMRFSSHWMSGYSIKDWKRANL